MQLDNCIKCARKHVRQAAITWLEAQKGHPDKWDMAQGHLAEAEDALIAIDKSMVHLIREERLALEKAVNYPVRFNYLFEQFDCLFEAKGEYYANINSEGEGL